MKTSATRSSPVPSPKIKGVAILGATGSIGVSTLNVLSLHPDRYKVVALTGNTRADRIFEQCRQFQPQMAVMRDDTAARELERLLRAARLPTQVSSGVRGLEEVAAMTEADVVMSAIVGAAGLLPTLAAIRAGKRVLLANKEPLVMSGQLCMREARRCGAELLPIDSEHNAIFQCMPGDYRIGMCAPAVRRILLTCSGGPFLNTPLERLLHVTPGEAVAHPRWVMGRKISVDSATLMNKGLELIEACRLFDLTPDRVEVVIHPQSIIHSLVEYVDGSVLAQLSNPDMRTPIAHALAWPERIESGVEGLDLFAVGRLDFARPDVDRFPCLRLAYEAARAGGTAPAVLNAANEVAVAAFLAGRIGFLDIARVVEETLDSIPVLHDQELDAVLLHDARARSAAEESIACLHAKRG